ncbi:hypothetical protein BGX38DRAFT_475446 [Terfezia claveryi]|nr:hypothetical protein BGX38DRAFT_475446 [Terfezia claveryi]
MAPLISLPGPLIYPPASGRVIISFKYINQAIESHLDSLLRYFSRETALYIIVKRQRKEYDPNDPLTEEQREMKAGDTAIIITAVVSTTGVILVLILLWYVYRRYQRHAAKKRERATHRARNVPPPPSLEDGSLPNPDDISLNDLHERDIGVPESGARPSNDSSSPRSITVVLDFTGTNDIIVTPLSPATTDPQQGREVNPAIGSTDPQPGSEVNFVIGSTDPQPGTEVNFVIGSTDPQLGTEVNLVIGSTDPQPGREVNLAIGFTDPQPGTEVNLVIGSTDPHPGREVNLAIGSTDPQPGREVNSAICSTVVAPDAEVVDITPQASPDVPVPAPTEVNTHNVDDYETVFRVGHQVPPYVNEVRAERRRRDITLQASPDVPVPAPTEVNTHNVDDYETVFRGQPRCPCSSPY